MDLIKCPRCGEQYSPSYRRCPFCEEDGNPNKMRYDNRRGRHVSEKKKTHSARGALIVILAFVLLLLTWYLFGEKIVERFTPEDTQQGEVLPPVNDPPQVEAPVDPVTDPSIGDAPVIDAPEPPVQSYDVSNAALSNVDFTASVGESVQLRVTGTDAPVTWSSDDSAVATVSEEGLVKGVASGMTNVRAKVGDRELSCIVRVSGGSDGASSGADASNVSLNSEDFTATVGEKVQLRVTGTDAPVTWSIADSSIASIDANGLVRGKSPGMTKAYAKVGGKLLTCIVRIK